MFERSKQKFIDPNDNVNLSTFHSNNIFDSFARYPLCYHPVQTKSIKALSSRLALYSYRRLVTSQGVKS